MPETTGVAQPALVAVPETATAARTEESRGVFWMLATAGIALAAAAWLLPWFVGQTGNGVGFSPQDVVSSAPTGIGAVLVDVLGLCLLGLLAGFLYDAGCAALAQSQPLAEMPRRAAGGAGALAIAILLGVTTGTTIIVVGLAVVGVGLLLSLVRDAAVRLFRGRTPYAFMEVRAGLAVVGLVCTLLVWVLIGIEREEALFGTLQESALTDNAVWMMLTGMGVLAVAYLGGSRIILVIGSAAATALALTGAAVPWFHTDAPLARNRVGYSLLDALGDARGLSTVLLWVVALAVVVVAAGLVLDLVQLALRRRVVILYARERAVAALVGAAAATAVVCYTVSTRAHTFGSATTLDNRVGFILAGLLVSALVLLAGERMVASRTVALAVVAFVVGGLFPLIFNQSDAFISWGASFAAVYVLLALGLNVVVGFAGLLDLGYAAFFAIGAYTAGSLNSPRHGLFLPFWIILFLGAAAAALFGGILGAPTLRLRGDYLAIVTLGFGEIVPDMAKNNLFGETGGPNGITGIHSPSIGNYTFGLDIKPFYWSLIVMVSLVMLGLRNLEHSRMGRAWVAIREDEVAAAATGINTVTTKLLAFAIGAAVSGLAGTFYGAILGIVTPEDFDFAVSVTALSTVVLGGIGNNAGAALGGVVVSFIIFWILPHMQEWATTFGGVTGITGLSTVDYNNYKYILYGVILMAVMLLRPGGLLPSRARRIELQTGAESEPLAAVQGVA